MAGGREKASEIWNLWPVVTHIWGTFVLVVFKVNLGSFGALGHSACLQIACISKMAGRTAQLSEICESGTLVIHI